MQPAVTVALLALVLGFDEFLSPVSFNAWRAAVAYRGGARSGYRGPRCARTQTMREKRLPVEQKNTNTDTQALI